jgi:hypothetical protein
MDGTNNALSPFQESLLALSVVHTDLTSAHRCLPKSRDEDDPVLVAVVTKYILILVASFAEEWRRIEHHGRDASIRNTLHVAAPFTRRIKQWPGISRVRSVRLAHPSRSKGGAFVHPDEVLRGAAVPTNSAETWLLGLCAVRACETAIHRHLAEYDAGVAIVDRSTQPIPLRGIRTTREIDEELGQLMEESRGIADKLDGAA